MPALAALLLLARLGNDRPSGGALDLEDGHGDEDRRPRDVRRRALPAIQAAVGLGVLLSALIYLNRSATDIRLMELVRRDDGRFEERPLPHTLPADKVTIVNVYGSVFYAGARTLEERLPRPDGGRPVVVLRLRGHTKIGATFVEVLADYADEIAAAEGRLYLAGVDHDARALIERTRKISPRAAERIFEATPILGASTDAAVEAGEAWLVTSSPRDDEPPAAPS